MTKTAITLLIAVPLLLAVPRHALAQDWVPDGVEESACGSRAAARAGEGSAAARGGGAVVFAAPVRGRGDRNLGERLDLCKNR
jgi:hypothetical protein